MMYRSDENWNGFKSFYNNGAPYGGIISTPMAMKVYCQELIKNNGILLSGSLVDEMLTEQPTRNGSETVMSLGWFKGRLSENDYYCHAGGGGGYYSEFRLYPAIGCGSVIMLNSSGLIDDRILDYLDIEQLRKTNARKIYKLYHPGGRYCSLPNLCLGCFAVVRHSGYRPVDYLHRERRLVTRSKPRRISVNL